MFQEQLNRYERAIYASLSGNLKPVWASVFDNRCKTDEPFSHFTDVKIRLMSISDPGGMWNLGRLCVGALQGDGGLTGGKGTDVIRNGWQSGGDAASRIPGGKVWPLSNILWSSKWIKLEWILDYLSVVGLWKRFLRSFKLRSQRWNTQTS